LYLATLLDAQEAVISGCGQIKSSRQFGNDELSTSVLIVVGDGALRCCCH
jgi:hypothetical protein